MKVKGVNLLFVIGLAAILASCSGSQNLAYLQPLKNSNGTSSVKGATLELYEARIKPKDLLSITVVTSEPGASRSYNLLVPEVADVSSDLLYSMPTLQPYMVDNDGLIDFPVLGKIKVAGLTCKELEMKIQKELEPAFSKERPIITIRFLNYSVNILGEVSRAGKYTTSNERLTIFEGLAMAGDMTLYGKRDNVKVLRENADGNKLLIVINLNDKNVINSPAYYLEQNDVVYVEPNESRSKNSNINAAETLAVSSLSIVISLASLIFNILK